MKKLYASILLILSIFMFSPIAESYTRNYVQSIPSVASDSENVRLGTLVIEEDIDVNSLISGDTFIVTLPNGVQYSTDPTNSTTSVNDFVYCDNPSIQCEITSGNLRQIAVRLNVNEEAKDNGNNKIYIFFGGNRENSSSAVNISDNLTGDIRVTIDGLDSGITSGEYVIGRVISGSVSTTILNLPTFEEDTTNNPINIRLVEDDIGALKNGMDSVTIELPLGFEWLNIDSITVTGDQNLENELKDNDYTNSNILLDGRKLSLNLPTYSHQAPQRLVIDLSLNAKCTEDNIPTGDVEAVVRGLSIKNQQSIVVAKHIKYGVTASTGYVPTIQNGTVQTIADIIFKEQSAGSLIEDRTISLTLPEGVSWYNIDEDSDQNVELKFIGYADQEKRIANWKVLGSSINVATLTLEDMKVYIESNNGESLVVEVGGSAGVTGNLIVANGLTEPTEQTFKIDPSISVMNNNFNYVDSATVDQQHYICANISNVSGSPTTAIIIFQVLDGEGQQVQLTAIKGLFTIGQKCNYSVMWTPSKRGTYKANIFVWSNWLTNGGKSLAEKQTIDIDVN